jgi:Domain of unknown function (DUF3859)
MRGFALAVLLAIGPLAAGSPALAEPAPPVAGPGLTIDAVGIFCRKGTTRREAAPETTLGYIELLDGLPELAFRQQTVPARIGVQFGVIVTVDRDIPAVRNETWKPGATTPEVWFADHWAGVPRSRGFSFDFPNELVPGIWRMQAFDGDKLLYTVEFDVVPGTEQPGIGSDCNLLS